MAKKHTNTENNHNYKIHKSEYDYIVIGYFYALPLRSSFADYQKADHRKAAYRTLNGSIKMAMMSNIHLIFRHSKNKLMFKMIDASLKDNLFLLDEALYNSYDCQIVRLLASKKTIGISNIWFTRVWSVHY
eukprot:231802_1